MSPKTPEILAPVGTMEMCEAAVHNGADAIYVGMPGFNARGRTATLSLTELEGMINFCHRYGVKVFIAFNVLIFEDEIAPLLPLLCSVIELGPDAFIVQDVGLAKLIRFIAPGQAVHASTQMTVTNAEAIQITSDLGMNRYVLGREVSIPEMQRMRAVTSAELEVFVHGALCVSYSGQCLTSERAGGRSANRGQCAQSCRLPYELIVDGQVKDLNDRRYLVSPKDLCAVEDVPKLMEIGIDSFKIEGRLKSPEFVASAVRTYKDAVTKALRDPRSSIKEMTRIYSRGFFNGWMGGVNHQELVDARYGNHHGLELGEIVAIDADGVVVNTRELLTKGDGVVFADFKSEFEAGGPIYSVQAVGKQQLKISLSREFNLGSLSKGMRVFLNSSPALEERWRRTYTDKTQHRKVAVAMVLRGQLDTVAELEISDGEHVVSVQTTATLEAAKKAPLSSESATSELGALSGTCFELVRLDFKVTDKVFLHNKELKELRRRGIELIEKARTARQVTVRSLSEAHSWIADEAHSSSAPQEAGILTVLIRSQEQIEALRGLSVEAVYLDFEFGKEYAEALKQVRELGIKCGISTTRILKPGELGHLDYIRRLSPDLVLVRNLGALQYFQDKNLSLVGDFSLNVANSLTANWMLSKRLERVCPSYDLNRAQLTALLKNIDSSKVEVTVHQYMPAFHMEHCVFAAFLSKGTSFKDCGRPCEKHRVELRDPQGVVHPLKPDAECRNTMFNGVPQSAAQLVPELLMQGVRTFRLEALYEDAPTLKRKIEAYLELVRNQQTPEHVFKKLGVVEQYGVSSGQLLNIRSYKDRKKDSASVLN